MTVSGLRPVIVERDLHGLPHAIVKLRRVFGRDGQQFELLSSSVLQRIREARAAVASARPARLVLAIPVSAIPACVRSYAWLTCLSWASMMMWHRAASRQGPAGLHRPRKRSAAGSFRRLGSPAGLGTEMVDRSHCSSIRLQDSRIVLSQPIFGDAAVAFGPVAIPISTCAQTVFQTQSDILGPARLSLCRRMVRPGRSKTVARLVPRRGRARRGCMFHWLLRSMVTEEGCA